MFGFTRLTTVFRHALVIVFAMTFMVRAVVPAGWMVVADAEQGKFEVRLCTGHLVSWDPVTGFEADLDQTQDENAPDNQDVSPQCPYALNIYAIAEVTSYTTYETSIWRSLTVPRPSTGPPVKQRSNQAQLPARGPPHSI
jgi:hypothetical protein